MVRRISLAILGTAVFAAVALVLGGPGPLERILPRQALDYLESAGVFGLHGRSGQRPQDFLQEGADGLVAVGPIAAGAGNRPVFIGDVVAGYTTRAAADIPAEVTTIRPIMGCRPTPPQEGTHFGHVTAGTSGIGLALSTYDDSDLAAGVQRLVDHYRQTGNAAMPDLSGPGYEAYDVAVTETSAPVYLVLETGAGNRMWNLHLAPGARIERVILLGGTQAGIANLDPVVPVEVILDADLASCGIHPAYGSEGMSSGAEAYDRWFLDAFGVAASSSRIGFDRGTISLVGPVPGAEGPKASYAPINGARIRATQDQFFEIRGQAGKGENFAARVKAIALTFAFGDLDYLRQGASF
ncbi:hypothetical protein [Tabrizicola sp.]|uniref:hypothetical protein n=1 Tax=Tabrizicola sp. TaxID=2005166 RepID=UPI0035AE4CDE